MRFLILNDSHDKGRSPVNRTDDFHQSILLKLDETLSIAKKEKVDFIIHLGDVWDTPNVSWTIIDSWIDRIEESGITFWVLPGNHDMTGASWETSETSALAHAFKRSKYFKMLTEIETDDIYIKGYPYFYECEKSIEENGLLHNKKKKLTVACTHAFITKEAFPFATHVKIEDIKSNYDYVLCSHLHKFFEESNGKTYYKNLGAFGRTSISESGHEPRVAILDTEKRSYQILKLNSAKKAEESFNLEAVKNKKEFNSSLEDFVKSLESVAFQGLKIENTISTFAKENNIEKEVVDLILEKIKGYQHAEN